MESINKTALITGATSGIGTVILKYLVDSGYDVIVLGRSKKKMEHLHHRLKIKSHQKIHWIPCDLSSFTSMQQSISKLLEEEFQIDLILDDYGHFEDVPLDFMFATIKQHYPHIFKDDSEITEYYL